MYKLVTCSSTQSFRMQKLRENPTVVGRSEASVCLVCTIGDVNLRQLLLLKEIDLNSFYTRYCTIRACVMVGAACNHTFILIQRLEF
jgi:hypothetical protein